MNKLIFVASLISTVGLAAAASAMQQGPGQSDLKCGFERVDLNGDGEVSQDEMEAARAARFNAADTDGSGGLSKEEIAAAKQQRREMRRQCNPRQRHFAQMDTNSDGQITREENAAAADARFDRMDANGDGVLTIDELPARPQRGHHRRRQ